MGHEFMEMKNSNAAIQSYRHAIGVQLNIKKSLIEPFNFRNKQSRLSRLVWFRANVRNSKDAFLLFVLLQKSATIATER